MWVIAPSYSLGESLFNDVKRLAGQIPGAAINRSDRRINYPGDGLVQVKSGDTPELLRGSSLDFCLFDEAAFMAHLEELWQETIRPSLADRRGKALFLSTPSGKNFFWSLFQLGIDPLQPEWASWQMPTSSNPYIDPAEIEAARRQLTERQFAQEFLAEFSDSASVFRNVRELATAQPQSAPQDGHEYVSGIDWGRSGDYSVIVIYDATQRAVASMDRFTGLPFDVQLNRIATVIERWRPATTVCELNSFGLALFESLQKRWLPTRLVGFTTSNQSKGVLVDCLSLALERQEITLLNDPVMIGELMAYQAETLPSGLIRYGAPMGGGHDDTVMALMLSYAPNAPTGPAELRPQPLPVFAQGVARRQEAKHW